MAEVGGEHRKLLLDVLTFAIPNEQRPDGEAVPEVVHAWPGTIAGAPEPDLSGQAPEDAMNILVQQAAALLSDEEGQAAARPKMLADSGDREQSVHSIMNTDSGDHEHLFAPA